MRSDSITEQLAKRDIAEDKEDIPLINNIGEEENVHASFRHVAELIEEEEEVAEVPLIIAEDDEDENASIEGVNGNREEINPVVSQGMASSEEGNVAIATLSSEENEEEELTVLS